MDTPTPTNSAIANPATFHPALAASEWIELKEARGQTVNLHRIGTPHHLIQQPTLIERIHARRAEIGIAGPTPLIA
ncbi:hypothetical protein [Phaeobacter sp. NW0010-22]|uniref:hypothetical protein n=1 Tax=Phaeobacter sp. NW0010-22 TaxID=3135907 RepID=UPI003101E67A